MPVVNANALDLAEGHAVAPDVRAVGCPVHIDVAVYTAGPDAGESDAVVSSHILRSVVALPLDDLQDVEVAVSHVEAP